MKKKRKFTKKHGIITGALAAVATAVAMTAHVTHFPILILAFFGFVGSTMIESPIFKIIAGIMSLVSILVLIRMYKKHKKCPKKIIEDSNAEEDSSTKGNL